MMLLIHRFRGAASRAGTGAVGGLRPMEMSYPKFLEWASAGTEQWRESFPGTSRSNQITFTYDHLVCYMWQHYARCLVVISENPAVASASKEELPAVQDFVLVSRILATDAKRRMGYFAECAGTNEVLKVAEEQLVKQFAARASL